MSADSVFKILCYNSYNERCSLRDVGRKSFAKLLNLLICCAEGEEIVVDYYPPWFILDLVS